MRLGFAIKFTQVPQVLRQVSRCAHNLNTIAHFFTFHWCSSMCANFYCGNMHFHIPSLIQVWGWIPLRRQRGRLRPSIRDQGRRVPQSHGGGEGAFLPVTKQMLAVGKSVYSGGGVWFGWFVLTQCSCQGDVCLNSPKPFLPASYFIIYIHVMYIYTGKWA